MAVARVIDIRKNRNDAFNGVPGSAVGTVVGGFELTTYLGRGGMADVYAAKQVKSGARVAIKRMLPWLVKRRHFVELFFHEARVYASLSHPNIVRGLDVGLDDGVPFLVLELVEGLPCDALIRTEGAFPLGVAVAVARELLGALTHVHEARDRQGRALAIVHSDVAADNVMVDASGKVKLLDFGVAHSLLAGGPMNATELRGKIGCVSPEHLAGMPTDARSDLFSAGAFLAEMLIGRRLFASGSKFQVAVANYNVDEGSLAAIDANVPEPLRSVLYTALARDRERRFATARDFDRALTRAANQISRTVDDTVIRDWLSRRGLGLKASGAYERGPIASRPDLGPKIEEVEDELYKVTPTPPVESARTSRTTVSVPQIGAQRYRVRVGQYSEVRTMTHAEIVGAIVTHGIEKTTRIGAISQPFVAVGDLPGFAQLCDLPAYRSVPGKFAWQRTLDRRELPRLFFQLAAGSERGALEARCGTRWKRVFFDGGMPVFVASSDESELLGNRVRRLGLVGPRQLDELVTVACQQGRHLGDVIVAAKLMNPAEMLRLLVHQLEARVLELGAWTEGELGFVRGVRPGVDVPRPLGSPMRLPCRLVRSSYCDEEILAFLSPVAHLPLRLTGSLARMESMLTPAEAHVLKRLVTSHTLSVLTSSLVRRTQLRPELIRRAVYLGIASGLVEAAPQ
jgi:serine/threonine protein kinase